MSLQIVYVLTNPAMPGFVKIGKTFIEDVSVRLQQLYTTGVPFPFDLAFACKVPNADEVERALHRAFAPNRANPRERLLAVLKEALPFDENRAREWKVWLAFWAQAVGNTELTTEHGRRYAEWRELLEDLVGQIVTLPDKVCLEVDHLIAIVDGLGLRLTISNLDDERRLFERQKCEALLRSMITGLEGEQLQ